jgi:hypothetical protein
MKKLNLRMIILLRRVFSLMMTKVSSHLLLTCNLLLGRQLLLRRQVRKTLGQVA